jgi:large subunit ribosomal protein L28
MAKQCEICGKGTVFGRNVSHAHNVTSRTWEPNLRSGKIVKAPVRNWKPEEGETAKG